MIGIGKAAAAAGFVGFAALLGACSSETPAQEEVREQAEAIEESYDAEADIVESLAVGAPEAEQEVAEVQADALREQGEQIEQELREGASELDEVSNAPQ